MEKENKEIKIKIKMTHSNINFEREYKNYGKKITYKLLLNYFTNLFHMYTPEHLRKVGGGLVQRTFQFASACTERNGGK